MNSTENATKESVEFPTSDSANKTVSTKLSTHELSQLEALAERYKTTNSALIRELILAKIQTEKGPQKADLVLTEIVGVYAFLQNVLGPLVCGQEPITKQHFDAILAEIKKGKHKAALQLQNGETRK
jgi:hypothetical protein